jgi:hypothetical protein
VPGNMAAEVKIFGERNSGTNLLEALLRENTSCHLLPGSVLGRPDIHGRIAGLLSPVSSLREIHADYVLGDPRPRFAWKHAATNFDKPEDLDNVTILFLVKNPLSWLVSMTRRPHQFFGDLPKSPAGLANVQIRTRKRELLGRAIMTPLNIWQSKVRSYISLESLLKLRNGRAVFVSFEELVSDQLGTLSRLEEFVGGSSKSPAPILKSTKQSHFNADDYKKYYLEEKWKSSFLPSEIPLLLARVDQDILFRFNYWSH